MGDRFLFASCALCERGGIVKAHVDDLGAAGEDRAGLVGVAADGDDVVEGDVRERIEVLGGVPGDVHARLAHHADGAEVHAMRGNAGGVGVDRVRPEMPGPPLGHLATARVPGAQQQDVELAIHCVLQRCGGRRDNQPLRRLYRVRARTVPSRLFICHEFPRAELEKHMRKFGILVACARLVLAQGVALAQNAGLKKGDRVAICGDSITEQKQYTVFIEDYLLMCKPAADLRVCQFGWGGERAPGFRDRIANDVLWFKPTVATTAYGMNDGQYRPYTEETGKPYRDAT